MKMVIIFLVIFIHQDFVISANYSFEIIKELIPKTIIFKSDDLNPFKIFQYIPSCSENDNYQKSIYLQMLYTQGHTQHIYIYDDFSQISQNRYSKFENYIEDIKTSSLESSVLFNIDCKKEYFFVIFLESVQYSFGIFPTLSGMHFNIIDSKKDIIHLCPELSDIFHFIKEIKIAKKLHFILIMKQNMVY